MKATLSPYIRFSSLLLFARNRTFLLAFCDAQNARKSMLQIIFERVLLLDNEHETAYWYESRIENWGARSRRTRDGFLFFFIPLSARHFILC